MFNRRLDVHHHYDRPPRRINISGVPIVGYFGLFFVQLMESYKLLNAWFLPGSVALVTLICTMTGWRVAVWIRNREPVASFFGVLCFVGVWFCIMPLFKLWSHQRGLVQSEVATMIVGAFVIDTLWNSNAPARRLLRRLGAASRPVMSRSPVTTNGNASRHTNGGRSERRGTGEDEETAGLRPQLDQQTHANAALQNAHDQLQTENQTLRDKLSGAERMIASLTAKVMRPPHDERPSLDIVPAIDLGPNVRLSVPDFDDVPRLGNNDF